MAHTLKSADIQYIHSSDYIRTRDTAAPLAKALGIKVEIYDPRNLKDLADKIKSIGGRHLVVGHSNTTPAMAELLGGNPKGKIDEANEYDRLYSIAISQDGSVQSTLLRYGK